jgi:hypothetical protein
MRTWLCTYSCATHTLLPSVATGAQHSHQGKIISLSFIWAASQRLAMVFKTSLEFVHPFLKLCWCHHQVHQAGEISIAVVSQTCHTFHIAPAFLRIACLCSLSADASCLFWAEKGCTSEKNVIVSLILSINTSVILVKFMCLCRRRTQRAVSRLQDSHTLVSGAADKCVTHDLVILIRYIIWMQQES